MALLFLHVWFGRRSHELRTKLAARSLAFQSVYLLIFRSRPTFHFLATSADDSIHPVHK
ncbi:hypothetical protein J6590_033235 [Homalodisca vitripennis]|nr:hypothetical protein J6590_033235 [Homalodisca vitripennis]